jgi:hypothetical protein
VWGRTDNVVGLAGNGHVLVYVALYRLFGVWICHQHLQTHTHIHTSAHAHAHAHIAQSYACRLVTLTGSVSVTQGACLLHAHRENL